MSLKVDDKEFKEFLKKARRELSPQAQDKLVDKTAHQVRARLVDKTPSRSGGVRNAWQVTGSNGERRVINMNPVMGFIEYGTPRKNPGAKIYPKNAKVLAIPKKSMTQTVRPKEKREAGSASKFIFVKWVRGMKPKKIVEKYMPSVAKLLMANIKGALLKL